MQIEYHVSYISMKGPELLTMFVGVIRGNLREVYEQVMPNLHRPCYIVNLYRGRYFFVWEASLTTRSTTILRVVP